ncbi:MAG: type II secretion system F family protein [Planctomycetes bacterium]|nr:type II secretion system F family protein [Planctomycetota bacterium]
MPSIDPLSVLIFLAVVGMVFALSSLGSDEQDRVAARVAVLAGHPEEAPPRGTLARLAALAARVATPLLPINSYRSEVLRKKLAHAGLYQVQAPAVYLAVQIALALLPWPLAIGLGLTGKVTMTNAAIGATFASGIGFVTPGFWLGARRKTRQSDLRRGLPDFFDILILCLEGGTSLLAAWRIVTADLEESHPNLWRDLKLVEREVEIGLSGGDALRHFADRTDLDELVSLASVVGQAERLGTELVPALLALADQLRAKRVLQAEEAAHKAATAILFPTLLFIFPGVLAIILGPMIIQTLSLFSKTTK